MVRVRQETALCVIVFRNHGGWSQTGERDDNVWTVLLTSRLSFFLGRQVLDWRQESSPGVGWCGYYSESLAAKLHVITKAGEIGTGCSPDCSRHAVESFLALACKSTWCDVVTVPSFT